MRLKLARSQVISATGGPKEVEHISFLGDKESLGTVITISEQPLLDPRRPMTSNIAMGIRSIIGPGYETA